MKHYFMLDTYKKNKYVILKWLMLIASCLLMTLIVYKGYALYKQGKEEAAFSSFVEILEKYDRAIELGSKEPLEEISNDITSSYEKHKSTDTASFFLILQGQNECYLKNFEKGYLVFNQLLNKFTNKDHLYYLVRLMYAQFLCISKEENIKTQGYILLDELIHGSIKMYKEIGMFYKGMYLFYNKNLMEADEAWKPLLSDPTFNNSVFKEKVLLLRNCNIPLNIEK